MSDSQPRIASRRDLTLWVALLFLLLYAAFTQSHINSWNEISRLASVEALVQHGTWAIDNTALGNLTGDKIFLNGRFYSDKPPILSLAGAGVYAALHWVFGLSFSPQECNPITSPCHCIALMCLQSPDWAYYLLTVILVGVPSALMLALFYRSTTFFGLSNPPALLLTGVLGLGTAVWPYSLVLNNHVPAAASLLAALHALIRSKVDDALWHRWLLVAGFVTALAFVLDPGASPFLIFFSIFVLLRHRIQAWPFLLGGLVPLALTAALDWWMLGDPLLPTMHAAGFNYPGSVWPATIAGVSGPANVLEYGFRMLVGDHGLFAFSPVLLWVIYALAIALHEQGHWLRGEAAAVGLASLATLLSLILNTYDFGGAGYSVRNLTIIVPSLFFFAVQPSLYRTLQRRLVFAALSALSIFSAWQGALAPWGPVLPPLRLETAAAALEWPAPLTPQQIGAIPHRRDVTFENHPARLVGYALDADTARPGEPMTVTLYWEALAPMSDSHALFVHLINSAGAFTAQRDVFPGLSSLPTSYWQPGDVYADAYRVDIGETAYTPDEALVWVGLYRKDGPRLAARGADGRPLGDAVSLASVKLVPRPGDLPNSARMNFGNQVALVGYDLNTRVIRPGETLSVTLYWQALASVERDYSVFLHLTSAGKIAAANDGLPYTSPKRMRRWLPGQVFQEVRPLTAAADAPVGLYNIEVGVFDESRGRLAVIATDGHYLGEQHMLLQVRVGDK
jgi:hypothetical protein